MKKKNTKNFCPNRTLLIKLAGTQGEFVKFIVYSSLLLLQQFCFVFLCLLLLFALLSSFGCGHLIRSVRSKKHTNKLKKNNTLISMFYCYFGLKTRFNLDYLCII
jgi:hypothetical protein